jgi:hypothetical protein
MKLRSNPIDDHSKTYELTVKYFKSGTAKESFMFQRDLKKNVIGQNIIAPSQFSMGRLLLVGDALTVFKTGATEHGNKTNAKFILTLQSLTTHIVTLRALAFQKQKMRRHMREPREMTTQAFGAQVAKCNAYLLDFSTL